MIRTFLDARWSLAVTLVAAMVPASASAADCDRACLIGAGDQYIAALVTHNPKAAPLSGSVRMAENARIIKPGEGFWRDATGGPTDFKIYVPDPVSRQLGFIGVMKGKDGKPVQIALRLKLDNDRKIVEAEQLVVREVRDNVLANLQRPRPGLISEIPAGQRLDRQTIIDTAAKYYDAVDNNRGADAPFADDCVRHENGIRTTGNALPAGAPASRIPGALGCSAQLDTNIMAYIGPIDRRDVSIADPVTGLAMGWSILRHPMLEHTYRVFNVSGYEKHVLKGGLYDAAFDNFAGHIIKVGPEGRIHDIEAVGYVGGEADLPSPF